MENQLGGKRMGRLIAHLRRTKGWTQRELATELGSSQALLSKWERAKTKPSRNALERLSEKLETPIEVFYEASAPLQSDTENAVIDPELAHRLVEGSKFAGGTVQRWILNEIENALIRAGVDVADQPDWIRELREDLAD